MARISVLAAATFALGTLAGCAPTETTDSTGTQVARTAPRCFPARNARSFRVVNSTAVNVRVGRDVYRLDLIGVCPDFTWTNRLALVTSGTSQICTGTGLGTTIIARGPGGTQRCAVRQITALTAEQVQALPARERP
ncbi:MAG TPA: DUF6491 family protein [Croceibacterium sp.]|nr:DUF6491 family protein [Croceibacterium sp.]